MEWIRTANLKKYNIIEAFNAFDQLDWVKSGFEITEGDTVYIYVGKPFSKILFKTTCICPCVEEDKRIFDKKFWGNPDDFNNKCDRIRLKLESKIVSNTLSIEVLRQKHLIKATIQGAYKATNYPELFSYIKQCFDEQDKQEISAYLSSLYENNDLQETEKNILVKARIGQEYFKKKLLNKYSSQCVVCGLDSKLLLVGSHIKPWAEATSAERLDENNGLLLCVMHDALFDRHLISFDKDGNILISKSLTQEQQKILQINPSIKINIADETKHYMKVHYQKFVDREQSPII